MKILNLGLVIGFYSAAALATEFKVDPDHSNVGFSVTHLMVSTVHGSFNKIDGQFWTDDKSGKITKATCKIDASSVDTRNGKRDDHLKSPDFLDVAKTPTISFASTKYEGTKEKGTLTGNLTIHGVTKPVTLDVTVGGQAKDPWGNERMGLTASGKINRKDFGLNWNKTLDAGGTVVSDEVALNLEIEGIAQKAPAKK